MAFLDSVAIGAACADVGWRCEDVVASTGSTNADLAHLARSGVGGGVVLVAAHQSQGRGRLARAWSAPPDTSLACSVLVKPRRDAADWGWLPLLVGLAVAEGIRRQSGIDAQLKWPNDVLVGDRKISGILCEAVPGESTNLAVLGFGINVAFTSADAPVPTATSLMMEGSNATATAVLCEVVRCLAERLSAWEAGDDVRQDYLRSCLTLGHEVEVQGPSPMRGTAVDVDTRGALIVEAAGRRQAFLAGDVVHLRSQ